MQPASAFARIEPADRQAVDEAAAILRAGGIVAFPTETVYGLGADATSAMAVARIYAAKGRPSFNPLIAHVSDIAQARREGKFNHAAEQLAAAFWPGPLTLVVPVAATGTVCELARAGLESIALRMPAHPVARALIAAAGCPLAAPSANRSGHVSPTTARHVADDLDGSVDLILNGGDCPVGLESTIIACLDDTPRLLRPGGIARRDLEAVLGHPLPTGVPVETDSTPIAPGLLASHYAPKARVRLAAHSLAAGEAGLDFGGQLSAPADAFRLDLSERGDIVEAAANLFGYLRRLDATGAATIAVAPIPSGGLGEAINDRLARAAASR